MEAYLPLHRKPEGRKSQTACTGLERDLSTFIQARLVFPSGVSEKSLGESELKARFFSAFSVLSLVLVLQAYAVPFIVKRFMHSLTESLQTDDLKIRLIKLETFLPTHCTLSI